MKKQVKNWRNTEGANKSTATDLKKHFGRNLAKLVEIGKNTEGVKN